MASILLSRRPAAGTLALATLLASAAGAHAAVSVTNAKIEGGKLVVSGTASSGAQLRLDGQEGAAFNARAGADGSFGFSLVYHPGDCVVTVEALVPPYLTAGEAAEALVADCGPAGVTARGAWVEAAAYVRNDLVTHEGSTWRARRNNLGDTPAAGADWEIFAAAGEAGSGGEGAGEAEASAARASPTGPAGGDLSGTYPNPQIADDAVGTNEIADGTVKSIDILNNSIGTQDILHDTITGADIAPDGVTSSEILDGTVAAADIGAGAVTGDAVLDNSLTSLDLGTNAVGSSEIASSAVGGSEIASNAVSSADVLDETLAAADIGTGAITSDEVLDDTQIGGGLAAVDLQASSVGQSEIATDGVAALEIQDNSIDSGEIVDFQLTNQDVGVLFAQVNANGTLANSSGSVTSSRIALGQYEVDFARNVTSCAPIATQGEAGVGGAPGAIMGATDRGGNVEAFFVTTRNNANASVDRAFHLVVVC